MLRLLPQGCFLWHVGQKKVGWGSGRAVLPLKVFLIVLSSLFSGTLKVVSGVSHSRVVVLSWLPDFFSTESSGVAGGEAFWVSGNEKDRAVS